MSGNIHPLNPDSPPVSGAALGEQPPSAPAPSKSDPARAAETNLTYHQIRCTICNHPEREAIEQDFLHWARPAAITHEYQLGDRRAIRRHARAFGLFERRAAQAQHTLGFIIEQADGVTATADSIIRAVRALSCLDENGHWTEPTRRVIITHRTVVVESKSKSKSIGTPVDQESPQPHAPQQNRRNQ
jgi:hypothetical protein